MWMLPDFLIVGPPRCGTKNLSSYLDQHPEICMAYYDSELHFFDRNYEKGPDWYKKRFEQCDEDKVIGEKTATYITKEKYAERIYDVLPRAKLVFIFREPVSRCYSDYWQSVKNGREELSFDEVVKGDDNKYIHRSKYFSLLKNFEIFPDEQKLILISERFWDDSINTVKDVYEFLNVDSTFTPQKEKKIKKGKAPRSKLLAKLAYNRFNIPVLRDKPKLESKIRDIVNAINLKKDYPPMEEETEKELKEYFMTEIKKLEDYIGKDLSIWYE